MLEDLDIVPPSEDPEAFGDTGKDVTVAPMYDCCAVEWGSHHDVLVQKLKRLASAAINTMPLGQQLAELVDEYVPRATKIHAHHPSGY
jgi:hypothetical protein